VPLITFFSIDGIRQSSDELKRERSFIEDRCRATFGTSAIQQDFCCERRGFIGRRIGCRPVFLKQAPATLVRGAIAAAPAVTMPIMISRPARRSPKVRDRTSAKKVLELESVFKPIHDLGVDGNASQRRLFL
jgi:hypothetical protein